MLRSKRVFYGVETERDGSRTPSYGEKWQCDHCDEWVEEYEQNDTQTICLDCFKEYVVCPRCGYYSPEDDAENGLCGDCQRDDMVQAAYVAFTLIREENIRTHWGIKDTLHEHAGIVCSVLYQEIERRKARRQKEKK